MKKSLVLTLLMALGALILPSAIHGQSQSLDLVYLRIAENVFASNVGSYMTITFSDGKFERIELEKLKANGGGAERNGELISLQIKRLIEMGYSLKSQSSGGTEQFHTIMIFIKE